MYILYLSKHDYQNGLKHLVKTTRLDVVDNYLKKNDISPWNGGQLDDKYIIIYGGEGVAIGDHIFFYRYINYIKKKFVNLKIYFFLPNERLKYLFSSQNIHIDCLNYIQNFKFKTKYTYYASLPSLAENISNKENKIPRHNNFFPINKKKEVFWHDFLSQFKSKLNIGISWKGSPNYKQDIYRSLDIVELKAILEINEINYYALNKDLTDHEYKFKNNYKNLFFINEKLLAAEKENAFIDTLAILKGLDLIITADTALAHISSAAGLKTYILLEYSPYWYWNTEEKNNFYQNEKIKFFKQDSPGNWKSVINRLNEDLNKLTKY